MYVDRRLLKSRTRKSIVVDSSLSSRTVRAHISVSKDLDKYFRCCDFWSHYDTEIIDNRSIRDIPVLSILLPFAWVTGADVYVNELDKTFADSMNVVHREYKKMYPGLPYRSKLIADRLVDNEYDSNETALLFSGGLDSTYSLFSNIALKPRLIMIFGTSDIPISNVRFQKLLEREYSRFAEREGLTLNLIRTNALDILNIKIVNHLFGSLSRFHGRPEGYVSTDHWPHYWNGIGFMLAHTGQTAPLSIGRFSRLIAGGGGKFDLVQTKYVDSSYAGDKIMWSNVRVRLDGENIHRHEKAIFLKQFFNTHRFRLRVCLQYTARSPDALNCNRCGKCLRTIAECAFAGIDPNRCGFEVDQSTFSILRTRLPSPHSSSLDLAMYWKPLQRAIPNERELNLYGAREFFDWLKKVNLDSSLRPYDSFLSNVYHRLPYPIADLLRALWEKTPAWRLRFYADLAFTHAKGTIVMKLENKSDKITPNPSELMDSRCRITTISVNTNQ